MKDESVPSFTEQVNQIRKNNIKKGRVDWDALVDKGQQISQLLEEIRKEVEASDGKRSSNEESILRIIEDSDLDNLIYNLNRNLVSARTNHRNDID